MVLASRIIMFTLPKQFNDARAWWFHIVSPFTKLDC
jgi:hypothetical protein